MDFHNPWLEPMSAVGILLHQPRCCEYSSCRQERLHFWLQEILPMVELPKCIPAIHSGLNSFCFCLSGFGIIEIAEQYGLLELTIESLSFGARFSLRCFQSD
jgi:hypothetical protein